MTWQCCNHKILYIADLPFQLSLFIRLCSFNNDCKCEHIHMFQWTVESHIERIGQFHTHACILSMTKILRLCIHCVLGLQNLHYHDAVHCSPLFPCPPTLLLSLHLPRHSFIMMIYVQNLKVGEETFSLSCFDSNPTFFFAFYRCAG